MKVGNPADPSATIGPMANRQQFERVQGYIARGLEEGATLVTGGSGRPPEFDRGFFIKPTVFANVTNDMTIAREEIFGPVPSIITYRDEDEAIAIANDSSSGFTLTCSRPIHGALKTWRVACRPDGLPSTACSTTPWPRLAAATSRVWAGNAACRVWSPFWRPRPS
jgi:delta 1-pyrroline-5-carboxylate dehydrogenase